MSNDIGLDEAKRIVRSRFPTAKELEVGDALCKGGGYGFYIVARRRILSHKKPTPNQAWFSAVRLIKREEKYVLSELRGCNLLPRVTR